MSRLLLTGQWISAPDDASFDYMGPQNDFEYFDPVNMNRSIADRFDQVARRYGDKIAVSDGRVCLTYDQVRRAALHLAYRLIDAVPATRPVLIALQQEAFFCVAALACFAAGRPFAPVDRNYPATRNAKVMQEVRAAVAITARPGDADELGLSIPCLDVWSSLQTSDDFRPLNSDPDKPAFILYTSGSTGAPKGICNAQRALMQRVYHATNSCHIGANDRHVLLSSFCTIAGMRETFSALLNGATLYVSDPIRLGISGVLKTLHENKITVGYVVPALLRPLLAAPSSRESFSSLRVLRVGGDNPLESDLQRIRTIAPQASVLFAFSSTEVPTIFQWFVPSNWQPDQPRLPIGYAQPGFEFKIEEPGAAVGGFGELVVRSPYVALGHWQDGRLTPGPFSQDSHDQSLRILHTGDMIRMRPDSLVEMLGRNDSQVKLKGYRVNLNEIETLLRSLPQISDVAVIARRRHGEVNAIVAFVVPALSILPTNDGLIAALMEELGGRLPSYVQPIILRVVSSIPMLAGFKSDLQALAALDEQGQADETIGLSPLNDDAEAVPSANRSTVSDAVARAWITVLNRATFEADVPWDKAGGDSLAAMRLWFMIEEALGPVPMELLRAEMKPSDLIQSLKAIPRAGTGTDKGFPGDVPHVFFMPPYDGDTPLLVRLRTALKSTIRFSVIHYPTWTEMIRTKANFGLIVDSALSQILSELDNRPVALAGYSFGGVVAWEVARRLEELGRKVDFVGLIDTPLDGLLHTQAPVFDKLFRVFTGTQSVPGVSRSVFQSFLRRRLRTSNLLLLNVTNRMLELTSARIAAAFQWHLAGQLRLRALDHWTVRPAKAPPTLFRSDERWDTAQDLGWRRLSKHVSIVRIGGTHDSILEPPHLETLCRHFVEAVGHSSTQGQDVFPHTETSPAQSRLCDFSNAV